MRRFAGKRSRASSSSTLARFESSGALSIRPRRRRISAGICCAVVYRVQEIALGGLRPERQRQLRQIAQRFNETGEIRRGARPGPEIGDPGDAGMAGPNL
jgi:hypothetical protein